MSTPELPQSVELSTDIEYRPQYTNPYRARVRWIDPGTGRRRSHSRAFASEDAAEEWIADVLRSAARGVTPSTGSMQLGEYGDDIWDLAMRGLEPKTLHPYGAGWRLRVVPTLGHIPLKRLTHGATDRAVFGWIADGHGRSTIKNSLAAVIRVMEQAVRDGIIDRNPARIVGWQQAFKQAEDESDDPRALALTDYAALQELAAALVASSHDQYGGWGDVVEFMGCTAARIGEASGVRVKDIDRENWVWDVCRQTTPSPGGLIDKGTKGKRRRKVPLVPQVRPMLERRLDILGDKPMARLFTGPRGGRITTAVLRDATHWDDVVVRLGYEYLRRHDLRHTALTWMADAGIPVHVLRVIAGHGSLTTTQRYLHPSLRAIADAGTALSNHLTDTPAPPSPATQPEPRSRGHLRLVR